MVFKVAIMLIYAVLICTVHDFCTGKLPDPILRTCFYAITEAENRVWPSETNATHVKDQSNVFSLKTVSLKFLGI